MSGVHLNVVYDLKMKKILLPIEFLLKISQIIRDVLKLRFGYILNLLNALYFTTTVFKCEKLMSHVQNLRLVASSGHVPCGAWQAAGDQDGD